MPRLLLVDDEPLARERLRRLLAALVPAAELREAPDGDAAVAAIRDWAPDAVFLDIQMPGRDGFQVIAAVGVERMPATVFVTGYDQHALRAFEVAAVDYLLKPFDDARLAEAWRRLAARLSDRALAGEARRFAALLGAVGAAAPAGSRLPRALPGEARRAHHAGAPSARCASSAPTATTWNSTPPPAPPDPRHPRRGGAGARSRALRADPPAGHRGHRGGEGTAAVVRRDQVMLLRDGSKLRVSRTRREAVAARLAGRPA